jgi:hypothetical protein
MEKLRILGAGFSAHFFSKLGVLVVVSSFFSFINLSGQCLEGDCKNGVGVYTFENGNRYKGNFRNSLMHGKGAIIFSNGNRYNGDWVDGLRAGLGIYSFQNGNIYTGSFKNNRFSGLGTLTFVSGNKYTGNWENDLSNGQGKFTFASGDTYEGQFKNGKFDGFGVMTYKNREKYEGSWRDNLRHGKGKMTRTDGTELSGVWESGTFKENGSGVIAGAQTQVPTAEETTRDCNTQYCREGNGVFKYGDGSRWVGAFKDGVPEGQGTCYYTNGDRYVGKFERHAPHGEGTMYFKNGRITGAIWEYGRPIGELPSNTQITQANVAVDADAAVKIWSVVVGVGRYSSMPVLKYSDDDAYQFYAFLKSPEGGALPDAQVRILVDEDATRNNVLQTMRQVLLRADDNDVIIFYFSGHGLEGSFLPQDFDGISNKLLHSEVKQILEQSRAKHKLCIADACHSGSLLAMKSAQDYTQFLQTYYSAFNETKGGTALMMSSKGQEYSLEDQGLRSGIFSHYLIRGLKGEADLDANKLVTVRELYDFVYKNVRVYTSNAQSPTISGSFDWLMPVSAVRKY